MPSNGAGTTSRGAVSGWRHHSERGAQASPPGAATHQPRSCAERSPRRSGEPRDQTETPAEGLRQHGPLHGIAKLSALSLGARKPSAAITWLAMSMQAAIATTKLYLALATLSGSVSNTLSGSAPSRRNSARKTTSRLLQDAAPHCERSLAEVAEVDIDPHKVRQAVRQSELVKQGQTSPSRCPRRRQPTSRSLSLRSAPVAHGDVEGRFVSRTATPACCPRRLGEDQCSLSRERPPVDGETGRRPAQTQVAPHAADLRSTDNHTQPLWSPTR